MGSEAHRDDNFVKLFSFVVEIAIRQTEVTAILLFAKAEFLLRQMQPEISYTL